jgi:hypothetical protein
MRSLAFGIVLILVLGIGSFMYRNVMERPYATAPTAGMCSREARICPDGTSVGRTGPGCTFAQCAFPNIELSSLGIGFALPAGYAENKNAPTPGDDLVAAYEKVSLTPSVPHVIVIRRYAIPEGKTANDVMLAQTSYDTSGEPVKSMSEFKQASIGDKTFTVLTVDRFEAQVHTVYYLPRAADVLRFEVLERDVTNWTEPSLVVTDLPEHQALRRMLETLQVQ